MPTVAGVRVGARARPRPRPLRQRLVAAKLYDPDTLMKLVGGVIMTSVWRFQDVFPGLSSTKLPLLISVAGLIVLAFDASAARGVRHLRSSLTWLLLLLCVQLAFATNASLGFGRSRSFMGRDFLWSIVAYFLVVCAVRSVRDLRWLLGAQVAGAVTYCVFVLLRFRGLDDMGRLCCTPYYDANDISLVVVSVIPYFLFFLRDSATAKVRTRVLVALLPVLVVFQRAGSRGGFIGLAVVILTSVIAYRGIKPSKRVWSLAMGVGALLVLGGTAYREKMLTILHPSDDYNVTADDGRIEMWKAGIALARQRPWVGYGPRSFGEAYGTFSERAIERGGVPWRAAHSAYVELAAEGGFPAVALLIAMLLTALVMSWRVRLRAVNPRFGSDGEMLGILAQSNAIAILGYIVSAVFLSAEYLTIVYIMFAFTVVLQRLMRGMEQRAVPAAMRPSRARVRPRGAGVSPAALGRPAAVR